MEYTVSIDVGIKNLAYCILTTEQNARIPKVWKWGVATLYDENIHTCDGISRANTVCGRTARYESPDANDRINRCAVHAKNHPEFIIPSASHKKSVYSKLGLDELRCYAETIDIDCIDLKKTALVKEINRTLDRRLFRTTSKTRSTEVSMVTFGRSIERTFDELMEGNVAINVLIENQIGPLAMRMKTIQGMLSQYFIMRGSSNIQFISSSNKLKVTIDENGAIGSCGATKGTDYKSRKAEGIVRARRYIETNQSEWLERFELHKKQDDLADSLLQGIWYICCNT